MIRVRNLSVRLGGRDVIQNIGLDLARGRVTVVIGPNGAGKSSLLRALAGLVAPHTGTIELDGAPLHSLAPTKRAQRIGYLPQNGTPAWAIRVADLVALGRLPYRHRFAAPSPADDVAIDRALRATNLTDLADRPVDRLSGGELARAKFARILAGESDWILADEPLANLDPPHQRDVLDLMRSAAQAGKGVVVVLHQLTQAAQIADDLIGLKAGQCLAAGPSATHLNRDTLSTLFDMALDVVTIGTRIAVLPGAPSLADAGALA